MLTLPDFGKLPTNRLMEKILAFTSDANDWIAMPGELSLLIAVERLAERGDIKLSPNKSCFCVSSSRDED